MVMVIDKATELPRQATGPELANSDQVRKHS